MNWVDFVVVGLLVTAAAWGGSTGFVSQVITFAGLLLGLAAGTASALWVSQHVVDRDVRAAVAIAVLLCVLGLFYVGAGTIASHFRHKVPHGWLRGLDTAAGTVFAMLGIALAVWLFAVPLAESPFQSVSDGMRGSLTMRVVSSSPPPPDLLATLRAALRESGVPTVFEDLPAPIGDPGPPPDPTIVENAAVQSVAESTVKVLAEACSAGSEGTGWVFAPQHVATNAHVVAGADRPVKVETRDGDARKASVVFFDPDHDIAVLYVPGLGLPAVPWTAAEAERDLSVAALGYPENGPFVTTPGRVRQKLVAKGRDIYDEELVDRTIYEVATRIRPGNSGGPLVSAKGMVYGMVFAASSTDNDIGYALTGGEIASGLNSSAAATEKVATGSCMG